MLQQFNILIQVASFSIISTKLFITSQRFLTIKHEGNETNKKDKKNVHNSCKEFSILLNVSRIDIRYGDGEEMEEQGDFQFLFLATFSLAASILKCSSTSSIGVSSFFLFTSRALFLTGSLQGSKGPSLAGFGFKKGSTGFVSPVGTIMYDTQSEILICGNVTFFLFKTVFIAQSKIFALLSVSSLCLLPNDSKNALLLICS